MTQEYSSSTSTHGLRGLARAALAATGLVLIASLACAVRGETVGPARESLDTFAKFQSPDATARPFVRWWWNGGRVDAPEIEREIGLMHRAGIGGVEINTIAMPDGLEAEPSLASHPAVAWLSPEWVKLVQAASAACRQHGMTADLIVGSGWPFGGRFLPPEEQTQRVILVSSVIRGPATLHLNIPERLRAHLAKEKAKDKGADLTEPTSSRLLFLRLLPTAASSGEFSAGTELLSKVATDGTAELVIPPGEHQLLAGHWLTGYTHVKLGAPGADGPVVNHFDATAVRHYLDVMSAALGSVLSGGGIRATFVDSLELDHANWTADLPQEFARRRGYDLMPYLPFLLEPPSDSVSGFNRTVLRARYDFCLTLTDLFEERFTRTYVAWAAANGVKARMQAYGRESHPLHGSMSVDLPEGETWLWLNKTDPRKIRVESTVANKYVSSAANLTGQRLRSFEAMTNAVPVFRETLENFKQGMDLSVLSGLNHPILHGFNYSPPDAGYPGWIRFGSYFNEQNPWWPHFPLFADYAARLGTVMRTSDAQTSIAVLAPRPDEWAHHGLLYQPFPEAQVPWYQYQLTEAIQQAGYNADYISERILENSESSDGKLHFGPRSYNVLILEDVASMEPAAAAGLVRFVAAGGTLVVVGAHPDRAPGLLDAVHRDATVNDAMRQALAAAQHGKGKVLFVNPPTESDLLTWTEATLQEAKASPDVIFDQPRATISQVFHRDGERAIYFLVNTSSDTATEITAAFPAARGGAWLWDPQTGSRQKIPLSSEGTLALRFAPLESKLIVFEPNQTVDRTAAPLPARTEAVPLEGPWQVELRVNPSGPVFQREFARLSDLSLQEDPALRNFGGRLVYRKSFEAPPGEFTVLDLGYVNGTTRVRLNGQDLGVRWWGRHTYAISHLMRSGTNTLEIEVTTVTANQMRSMKTNKSAQRWASWAPPIAMGLLGPVELQRIIP